MSVDEVRRGRHVRGGFDFENAARRAFKVRTMRVGRVVPPLWRRPACPACCFWLLQHGQQVRRRRNWHLQRRRASPPASPPASQRTTAERLATPSSASIATARSNRIACCSAIDSVQPIDRRPVPRLHLLALLLAASMLLGDLEFHPHGTELTTSALLLWHSLSLPVAASISCAPLVSASPERASTPTAGAPASLSSISLLPDPYHDVHAPTQHAVLVCPFPLRCSTRGHAPGKSKTWLIQHSRHLLSPPTTLTYLHLVSPLPSLSHSLPGTAIIAVRSRTAAAALSHHPKFAWDIDVESIVTHKSRLPPSSACFSTIPPPPWSTHWHIADHLTSSPPAAHSMARRSRSPSMSPFSHATLA